jgi:hypothetical protein
MPDIVRLCLDRTESLHPAPLWRVVHLCDDNLKRFVSRRPPAGFGDLSKAHQADWVRLAVLAMHGGVWLDATNLLVWPVSAFFAIGVPIDVDIQGFALPGHREGVDDPDPLLETWAMAAAAGNAFVEEWLLEWERAITMGLVAYCLVTVPTGLVPWRLIGSLPHLTINAAWCVVRARVQTPPARFWIRPSDGIGGPFSVHRQCHWDTACTVRTLVNSSDPRLLSYGIVKLRRVERDAVEAALADRNQTTMWNSMRNPPAAIGDGCTEGA